MMVTDLLTIVTSLLTITTHYHWLILGRLGLGIAVGLNTTLLPIYI